MSLQDSKKLETVKILMLKGEKGETGSYDDTQVRGLITSEAQARAFYDNVLDTRIDVIDAKVDELITTGYEIVYATENLTFDHVFDRYLAVATITVDNAILLDARWASQSAEGRWRLYAEK